MAHKVDSDGNPIRRQRVAPQLTWTTSEPENSAPMPIPLLPVNDAGVGVLLSRLTRIRGGYIKMRMDSDGSANHYTYTWSLGPHAHQYVYVRFNYWELEAALYELLRKILEVEEGKLKPSPDKYLT